MSEQRDREDLAETEILCFKMCLVLGQQKTVQQTLRDFAFPGQKKSGQSN